MVFWFCDALRSQGTILSMLSVQQLVKCSDYTKRWLTTQECVTELVQPVYGLLQVTNELFVVNMQ